MIPVASLVLGTVKQGLPAYGYGSTSRPTAQESLAVITAAKRARIKLFDTALGYGDAMALLAHAEVPRNRWIVKSRLPLRISQPWLYHAWLIHNPTLAEIAWDRAIPPRCGVSVYTVDETVAGTRFAPPVQAPASCLNPPVSVDFARAPFLQGVLIRDPASAPAGLQRAVRAFQALADDAGVSRVALALHSAHRRADGFLVFGVSSVAQLDTVLEAADQTVPADLIDAARDLATTVDATAALPSLWSRS